MAAIRCWAVSAVRRLVEISSDPPALAANCDTVRASVRAISGVKRRRLVDPPTSTAIRGNGRC